MADEKIFTVPLRNVWKTERRFRAKRAVLLVRQFLQKHMKADDVKIGKSINQDIWNRGAIKPPRRVRVHAVKEDNVVYAELVGVEIKTPGKEVKDKKKAKEKEKRERIKKERKERRKKTIQEEMAEESGQKPTKPYEKESEKEAKKQKEEQKAATEKKEAHAEKQATKGRA